MKYLLSIALISFLHAAQAADDQLQKVQVDYFKCIRSMSELRIDPEFTVNLSFHHAKTLLNVNDNKSELQKAVTLCQNDLLQLKNDHAKYPRRKYRSRREFFISLIKTDISENRLELDHRALLILSYVIHPKMTTCKTAGVEAQAAVGVGLGAGLSMGVCNSTNARKYIVAIPQGGYTLGLGAYVGIQQGEIKFAEFYRGETDDYESATIGIAIGVNYNMQIDKLNSIGAGAGAMYGMNTRRPFKVLKIAGENFEELLDIIKWYNVDKE